MELDRFVSQTLLMISKGVSDAQKQSSEYGCAINAKPNGGTFTNEHSKNGTRMQEVEFDVAVITEDTSNGEGKISVMGFASVNGGNNSKETLSSRVAFKVPISFNCPK
ncbi:hypothetical protein ACFFUS_20390 [Vibrio gallaecicus]|uniref:hypothetical protein n=1 Tax=Vibrio gallaecicus TaxID=552386 RepID=UPI0010C98212|nr:hypothetical protein [Vibrio gallaecicus]MDN3617477.1 hypothetical protein [Vibrio gallaecicus]